MDEERVLADVGDVDDLGLAVLVEPDAELLVGPEADRLAVLAARRASRRACRLARDVLERAVVEDVAVLVDLDERGTRCSWARRKTSCMCLRSMSWVRATNVASAPIATEIGLNGWSSEPNGELFVTFPTSLVGEYWPFVRP